MLQSNKRPAPSKNEQSTLFRYHGNSISYEIVNGKKMINATQMAMPFGKRPIDWLNTQQAKDLINTVSKVRKITLAEIQQVRKGGNNPGTWLNEEAALIFAQWLSPDFYLLCNEKLTELLVSANTPPKQFRGIPPVVDKYGNAWYSYLDVLNVLKFSTISGTVSHRKKRFPQHFTTMFGRNFIDEAMCRKLANISRYRQLRLDFGEMTKRASILTDVAKIEEKDLRLSLISKLGV